MRSRIVSPGRSFLVRPLRRLCGLVCLVFVVGPLLPIAACGGGKVNGQSSPPAPAADDGAYGGSFPTPPTSGDDDDNEVTLEPDDSAVREGDDEGDAGSEAASQPLPAMPPLPEGACAQPLGAGALRIDELMIESVAGTGDDGEWLEIESALDCAANLNGLHGECPRGSRVATFDVTSDVWIPPRGTFVVADSNDPAINHYLPGVVVAWFGHLGDVLRNQGATITLRWNGTLVDTVTYPSLKLTVGDSFSFPSGCDAGMRTDFTAWQRSTGSWFPGFLGTPNAPNTDVTCP
ncbi:MAG TPA: lamin tail domain-containing protein [Polyangiaceae bacterium]|nr:lamin tail domain-containing protein [Polyangiaceae bacterium]